MEELKASPVASSLLTETVSPLRLRFVAGFVFALFLHPNGKSPNRCFWC